MAGPDKLKRNNTSLTGAAGEHYVITQLLRRNYICALAPQGVPNADIIVTDHIGEKLCAIQVKTRSSDGKDKGWHMGEKHETISAAKLFYCFVDFGASLDAIPACYIVPSKIVSELLTKDHAAWLSTPGKKGRVRNDTKMRRFRPDHSDNLGKNTSYGPGWLDKHKDNWELLSN